MYVLLVKMANSLICLWNSLKVLFDLFRHDLRLWRAYSVTLQVDFFHFLYDSLMSFGSISRAPGFYDFLGSGDSYRVPVLIGLQSYPAFFEYRDLMEALEEKLAAYANSEEKY